MVVTGALGGCADPLAERHDVAAIDLDGVVYIGEEAVPGAVEQLRAARAAGMRIGYVTNNAARTPAQVARRLNRLGVDAAAADVVTSAQAAARLVAGLVPAGSAVLVVGGEGLEAALAEHDLHAVRSLVESPAAVVQGFHPDVGWKQLAEGSYAVAAGLPWVASNTDATLPTARGTAPGNGALVSCVRTATGRHPEVAGKPETPLLAETVRRLAASRPLVVGDRLDTDVEGANRFGAPSLLVLTGVTDVAALAAAPPIRRPTYVAAHLGGLLIPHPTPVAVDGAWCCGGWRAEVRDGALRVTGEGPDDDAVRAVVAASWAHLDATGRPADVAAATARIGR